jgi:hypothetical protein
MSEKKLAKEISAILKTEDGLQRLFKRYNDLFFNGGLPNISVKWSPQLIRREFDIGQFKRSPRTGKPKEILVCTSLRFQRNAPAFILLHEMAHLSLWQQQKQCTDHGPDFEREMLNLAMKGAFNGLWRKTLPSNSSRREWRRWWRSIERDVKKINRVLAIGGFVGISPGPTNSCRSQIKFP